MKVRKAPNTFYMKYLTIILLHFVAIANLTAKDVHHYTCKVIDSLTLQPLKNARITGAGISVDAVTDSSGYFSFTNNDSLGNEAFVYCDGYERKDLLLTKEAISVIYMRQLQVTLNEHTVNGKVLTVDDIIRKVKKNIDSNYDAGIFGQRFFTKTDLYCHDSVVADIDNIQDVYNLHDYKVFPFDLKEIKIKKYDTTTILRNDIPQYANFWANSIDFIRYRETFDGNAYKKYKYQLVKSFLNEQGEVCYEIAFYTTKTRYRYTFSPFGKTISGEIVVNGSDFAIISIDYQETDNAEKYKKLTRRLYRKRYNNLNLAKDPKLMQTRLSCEYKKDLRLNKYFVKTGTYTRKEVGSFVESGREYNNNEVFTICSIEEPKLFPTVEATGTEHFKIINARIKPNPAFWESFKCSCWE